MPSINRILPFLRTNGFAATLKQIARHVINDVQKNDQKRRRSYKKDDTIEFLCPFHRGDVLVGLQVATAAAMRGKKIRMHVAQELFDWLKDFPCKDLLAIEPIDIGVPEARYTAVFLEAAEKKVRARPDFSGVLARSHPRDALSYIGIDLTEHMLLQLGLSHRTKLPNLRPLPAPPEAVQQLLSRAKIQSVKTGRAGQGYVLLHPYAGWTLKSMTDGIIKQISELVHKQELILLQIGGGADKKSPYVDGYILENLSASLWAGLFKGAKAVIGVDSWTAHFASIVGANQAILYGSTRAKEVESKRHFKDSSGAFLRLDSSCPAAPCNSLVCKFGSPHCRGMRANKEQLEAFLQRVSIKKET